MRRWLASLLILMLGVAVLAIPRDQDTGAADAGDVARLSRQAEQAYQTGDTAGAEKLYQKIAEIGVKEPAVYHNLGQLYREQHRMGLARAAYLRALALDPRFEPSREAMRESGWELPIPVRTEEMMVLLVALNGLAVWAVLKNRRRVALTLVTVMAAGMLAVALQPREAVVVVGGAPVFFSPLEGSEQVAALPVAALVSVGEEQSAWVEVLGKGWVRREDLGMLDEGR